MKHTFQSKTAVHLLQSAEYWAEILTDDRMARLNHLRFRAGVPAVSREEMVAHILNLPPAQRAHIWGNLP